MTFDQMSKFQIANYKDTIVLKAMRNNASSKISKILRQQHSHGNKASSN